MCSWSSLPTRVAGSLDLQRSQHFLGNILATGDFNRDGNLESRRRHRCFADRYGCNNYLSGPRRRHLHCTVADQLQHQQRRTWIQGLWVGDFNGDGKLDLLAWFYVNVVPFQNNDVMNFSATEMATFAPAKLVIQNLTDPAVTDFNHDGRPDVVDNRDPQSDYPAGLAAPQFRIFLCQRTEVLH